VHAQCLQVVGVVVCRQGSGGRRWVGGAGVGGGGVGSHLGLYGARPQPTMLSVNEVQVWWGRCCSALAQ